MDQKNALISVFDKTGIEKFGKNLVELGWTIYSSGGTAKVLRKAGVEVIDVAELVGGNAILGHKVVTLSREVGAALLADQNLPEEMEELKRLKVPFIDLVCVDCYPLKEEIAKPDCTLKSVREKTDIGGPNMLREGVKGERIVICDVSDRTNVIDWLRVGKPDEDKFILGLGAKAERYVADYVGASASFLEGKC